jgi:hypothetical protein
MLSRRLRRSDILSYSLTDPDRDIGAAALRQRARPRMRGDMFAQRGVYDTSLGPLRALLGQDRLLRLQPCDPCFLTVRQTPPPLPRQQPFCIVQCPRSWRKGGRKSWRYDVFCSWREISFCLYSLLQAMKEVASAYAQVCEPCRLAPSFAQTRSTFCRKKCLKFAPFLPATDYQAVEGRRITSKSNLKLLSSAAQHVLMCIVGSIMCVVGSIMFIVGSIVAQHGFKKCWSNRTVRIE